MRLSFPSAKKHSVALSGDQNGDSLAGRIHQRPAVDTIERTDPESIAAFDDRAEHDESAVRRHAGPASGVKGRTDREVRDERTRNRGCRQGSAGDGRCDDHAGQGDTRYPRPGTSARS